MLVYPTLEPPSYPAAREIGDREYHDGRKKEESVGRSGNSKGYDRCIKRRKKEGRKRQRFVVKRRFHLLVNIAGFVQAAAPDRCSSKGHLKRKEEKET
ncbi:hypothetical protein KM043_006212 [Ampulex compressa]|nr:hypothetical protein KM043_006212 [Ampulex compressa]